MISFYFGIPFSPILRRKCLKQVYHLLATKHEDAGLTFMNYGYAGPEGEPLELEASEQSYAYSVRLYDHVASVISWLDQEVLEVGCGRGGGASFLMRSRKPKSITGMDFSEMALRLCRKTQELSGLRLVAGEAEKLPFQDESFDIVLNVESSHGYDSMPDFLSGVFRLLRPGGYFLLADFRGSSGVPELRLQLYRSGLDLIQEQDISQPVFRAMQLDQDRKQEMILKRVPKDLLPLFWEFAGLPGSEIYEDLKDGRARYMFYTLQRDIHPGTRPVAFHQWFSGETQIL